MLGGSVVCSEIESGDRRLPMLWGNFQVLLECCQVFVSANLLNVAQGHPSVTHASQSRPSKAVGRNAFQLHPIASGLKNLIGGANICAELL